MSSFAVRGNISDVDVFAWLERNEVASQSSIKSDDDLARNVNDDALMDSDDTSLDSDDDMAIEQMLIQ